MYCKPPNGCNNHFCWICTESFGDENDCTEHIINQHKGRLFESQNDMHRDDGDF